MKKFYILIIRTSGCGADGRYGSDIVSNGTYVAKADAIEKGKMVCKGISSYSYEVIETDLNELIDVL